MQAIKEMALLGLNCTESSTLSPGLAGACCNIDPGGKLRNP